jgi:hypothetical protein
MIEEIVYKLAELLGLIIGLWLSLWVIMTAYKIMHEGKTPWEYWK